MGRYRHRLFFGSRQVEAMTARVNDVIENMDIASEDYERVSYLTICP